MSQTAFQEFEPVRNAQLQKNEARRMRTLVNQARGDTHRSGVRWPFELTQNAHDPGPRPGFNQVNIDLSFDGHTVVFEHDGKPFSMQDLAALLSGGSSKEFESTSTTGRFGTGFLLTHVLSLQIDFHGVLDTKLGYEQVSLPLDRSGDEDLIYANTISCNAAIEQAARLQDLRNSQKTARFKYTVDSPEAARIGFAAFSRALPFLYGTCEHLGEVRICASGQTFHFSPGKVTQLPFDGAHILERQVTVAENDTLPRTLKTVRFRKRPDSYSSLVVFLDQLEQGWRVSELPVDFPRLFARFPVRTSDFLPVNAIIDGRFDLAQERDCILMQDPDKEQIAEALDLLPAMVRTALQHHWQGAHKLARIGMPKVAFGDPIQEPEESWWKQTLSGVARKLAEMPIVQTSENAFHKIAEPSPNAQVVLPRFDADQPKDELDFNSVWQAASKLKHALPPVLEIASDWTAIASEWMDLGISIERLALTSIADLARGRATKLSDLQTKTLPLEWLAHFLNLVGQVAGQHNCTKILSNLLPDQNGSLKSPDSLYRDAGVHDNLKEISARIKLDVRARLLLQDLMSCCAKPELLPLKSLLETQINRTLTNAAVIDECIDELSSQLPDTKTIPVERQVFRETSIDLLRFLWDSLGVDAAQLAQKCPLIAADGSAIRWSVQRKTMAPVCHWHQDARPFANIYKADRVLADDYLTQSGGDRTLVNALVTWDMAFADPLCTDAPKELRGERLKAISESPSNCEGVVVSGVEFSQLALLPNELIQRCQVDETVPKMLLGLALTYLARHDRTWEHARAVVGRRDNEDAPVKVTPALWISDLRTKAWVPVQGEQGTAYVIANAGNLNKLLNPVWLTGNNSGVHLLTKFFGFKELELRLIATAPSQEARKQLESSLAMLIQIAGADPGQYYELAAGLLMKKLREKEKERNRRFGLGVQFAIEKYLRSHNLQLELIDQGYDYDVYLDDTVPVEAGTHHFKLGDYLLEVKATTTGEVRLTPAQAGTASANPQRFVLCVVDLRGITQERMEADWTESDVEPRTKIVQGIGKHVDKPHGLVVQAKECPVGIRNDAALRYGVPVQVWETGIPVSAWVQEVASTPEEPAT